MIKNRHANGCEMAPVHRLVTFNDLSSDYEIIDGRTGNIAEGQYEIPLAEVRWKDKKTGTIWKWETMTLLSQELAIDSYARLEEDLKWTKKVD